MFQTYELLNPKQAPMQPGIVCKLCKRTSFHPMDVEQKYCGNCHIFHEQFAQFMRNERMFQEIVSLLEKCRRECPSTAHAQAFAASVRIICEDVIETPDKVIAEL